MPPKKASASTVTNSKGKEFEATAAAGRARRSTAAPVVDTPAPTKAKAAVKKSAPARKAAPAKASAPATAPTTGKKRGRPAKAATAADAEDDDDAQEPPKKKGRPAKNVAAVPKAEQAPPKKRGRPPKGGETTKAKVDDDAAAEQLEEELEDRVEAAVSPSKQASLTEQKPGRPAKKATGKGAAAAVSDVEQTAEDGGDGVETIAGKKYWLMKAEQEDREESLKDGSTYNAKFTIDDLRAKAGPEPWDGVRNPTACKNMKDMKLGDLAFFYASGGKGPRKPGIVGIMEIVKEAEPDTGAFDENNPYYVENPKMRGTEEKPRWFMVHVEFRKKLSKPVTLKELQKYAGNGGVLSSMQELTAARLSVSKVTAEEWAFINSLIEDYEDEVEGFAEPDGKTIEDAIMTNGGDDAELPTVTVDVPTTNGIPDTKQSVESEPLTTDSAPLHPETEATSRPAPRAGSKEPSSRAGSLQPPSRAASRARSRTPGSRRGSVQPANGAVKSTMKTVQE